MFVLYEEVRIIVSQKDDEEMMYITDDPDEIETSASDFCYKGYEVTVDAVVKNMELPLGFPLNSYFKKLA